MFVCLFDIDGTLIASGGAGKAALEAGFAEEFRTKAVIEKLSLSGRTDRSIVRDLLRSSGIEPSDANIARTLSAYLRHLPQHLTTNTVARVLPGVVDVLVRLSVREDVLVGLLTGNIRAGAEVKLGHFGLFEHFAFGGYGDLHWDRDDVAREALAEVRFLLGARTDPERIWVIGDTPLDIRCARAIGAKAVAVATGWHSREELATHQPDLLFSDLSNPAELFSRWA
jgi:phosphoglycolate phosphatase-like HAD superfamily hydrolase